MDVLRFDQQAAPAALVLGRIPRALIRQFSFENTTPQMQR